MRTARQLSVFLLFVGAILALYGGISMITDPTGNSVGFPFYLLNGAIFSDFLLLGWVLFVTVGIFSIVVIILILTKHRYYSFYIMLQGAIICAYVIILMLLLSETFMVEYFFLIMGMGMIGLGVLQFQRKIALDAGNKVLPVQKSHHHQHRKHK